MIIGIVAGFAWGAVAAVLNGLVGRFVVAKNAEGAAKSGGLIQTGISLAFLIVVVLLKGVLPFSYEAMLIGTVIAISLLGIVFTYKNIKR